jgi:acyl carrier protein
MVSSAPQRALTDDFVLAVLRSHAADALELAPEEVRRVTAETRIVEGLRLDSLRQVVLLTRVEEDFGFEFDPDDLVALGTEATVGDLVQLIRRHAGRAATT